MSADNYFLIRRHPISGYTPVMAFMSDDEQPKATLRHTSYPSVQEAIDSVVHEYTEYGIIVHPECEPTPPANTEDSAPQTDTEKLAEISRLLHEAYEHYFTYEGHCKSSEGHISVDFGNFWERAEDPTDMRVRAVEIYSYVFCEQGRSQVFDSIDAALATVRRWHEKEMAYDPNTEEAIADREAADAVAAEFIDRMTAEGRLTIIDVTEELDYLFDNPENLDVLRDPREQA